MTRAASRSAELRTLDQPRAAVGDDRDVTRPRHAPTPEPAVQRRAEAGWGVPLAVIVVGMFMSVLSTTSVNVALASMSNDLGAWRQTWE